MADGRDRLTKAILANSTPSGTSQAPAERNAPYVKADASLSPAGGGFNTQLDPLNEMAFRQWVARNKVPFDPEAPMTDYDMRGFYQALQQGHPRAASSINPNDQQMHYPDYWKTPMHPSFSQDSQWAGPMAPRWNESDQLIAPSGRILFDERQE